MRRWGGLKSCFSVECEGNGDMAVLDRSTSVPPKAKRVVRKTAELIEQPGIRTRSPRRDGTSTSCVTHSA